MSFVAVLLAINVGACGDQAHDATTTRPIQATAHRRALPRYAQPTLFTDAVTTRLLRVRQGELSALPLIERSLLDFGEPASKADVRAMTPVVKRYYAVAAAGDAKRACAMIDPAFTKALSAEIRVSAPSYLHGAKTCQAAAADTFRHYRHELTVPIRVNGALTDGNTGYVVVSSAKMPDSMIAVRRMHAAWVIDSVLGAKIPLYRNARSVRR
jgi:hypothetical protein